MVRQADHPPLHLERVSRGPSLKEKAYEVIKEHILRDLDAGHPLVVHELAEQLGISRTPVREALLALEQDGFVETIPHKGTFVASLSADEIKKIYDIREVLECRAVRLATGRIPHHDLMRVKAQLAEAKEALDSGDPNAHFHADTDLHSLIARHSGNELLESMIENLGDRAYRIRAYSRRRSGEHLRHSLQEHVAILDSLLAGDSASAEEGMREHIRQSSERIASLLHQQPAGSGDGHA